MCQTRENPLLWVPLFGHDCIKNKHDIFAFLICALSKIEFKNDPKIYRGFTVNDITYEKVEKKYESMKNQPRIDTRKCLFVYLQPKKL